jgi:hypothetical protein
MNWNQTQLNTRKPITLETSKRAGDILSTRISASLVASFRARSTSQPNTRTMNK